jgi:rhodanese-related sulfurtransferase
MQNMNRKPRRTRTGRARTALKCALLVLMTFALAGWRPLDWFVLKRALRAKFSDVDWITTRQLADWLNSKEGPAPVLLDVRTPAEWEVSHLANARRVDPDASAEEVANGLGKDTPIVTYCSVGYRSGEMAERLQKAGFTRVRNLEGSIFEWANEGRPLVREGKKVTTVHPYDTTWGRLLRDDVRAPLPSPAPRK